MGKIAQSISSELVQGRVTKTTKGGPNTDRVTNVEVARRFEISITLRRETKLVRTCN